MASNSNDMDTQSEQLPEYLKTKSDSELILSHTVLNLISECQLSFCDSHSAGQPTAVKCSLLIAVGYTKGDIILFDSSQRYIWCHTSVDRGAVSAIDFNHKCSRLLAGYTNGTIIMFDSSSTVCKVLQIMNDVLTPHTAVLHLKFTDLPNLAIVNDSSGSVFELNLKKTFCKRSVEPKRLISGHLNKVYCIEPLLFNRLAHHPMNGHVIIAMATLSKIIIFALRPNTKLLLSQDIIPSRLHLPLLSWQFVTTQFKEISNLSLRIVNPILVFIQDDTIYFYVVKLNEENNLCCCNLRKVTLPYMILAFSWMNHRTFLIMSSLKKVHLIDIFSNDEIECFDIFDISLVYTSDFYNGNDNQYLDKCCYSSVHSYNGQLIFLGDHNINILRVRIWTEYLESLTKKKLFTDALQLGVKFLRKKSKPIYDMRISQAPGLKAVEKKVFDIIALYIDSIIEVNDPIYYKDSIPIVMDICVLLKKTNILFNRLWNAVELFESTCNMFLECLVNYLVNDQINEVPTNIIQKLFIYLSLKNQFQKLEKCILNVQVECLDINQSVKLTRTHSLFDGLISIWTRALQDYTTPLQELVPKIITTNGEYNDLTIRIGNTILKYLSSCLLGIAYPYSHDIPRHLLNKVISNVIQFLCSLHSIKAKDDEHIYPYLRILLKFDTTKFLSMLRNFDHHISCHQKQRIICILSSLITSNKELNSYQLGSIYVFIVKWQKNDDTPIKLDKRVFQTVIELLTLPEQEIPFEETEEILSQLISLGEFNNYPDLYKIVEQAKLSYVNSNVRLDRSTGIARLDYVFLDKFRDIQEASEFALTQLQKCIQQEISIEECMKVLMTSTQRGPSVIETKSTWISILQYFISLWSHANLKKRLDSNDCKLFSEIQSLINSAGSSKLTVGQVGIFSNHIMGIMDNCQYKFQILKSPEIVDLHKLLIEIINEDKPAINPVVCSLCIQNRKNLPMITLRCGHRFHSDCLGVHTVCTFCISTNNNI